MVIKVGRFHPVPFLLEEFQGRNYKYYITYIIIIIIAKLEYIPSYYRQKLPRGAGLVVLILPLAKTGTCRCHFK